MPLLGCRDTLWRLFLRRRHMVGSAAFQRQADALQIMAFKSIAIGADHAGFALKAKLAEELKSAGYEVIYLGTRAGPPSVDYPAFGRSVAAAGTAGKYVPR